MDSVFSSQLKWAKPKGLYFNDSLERRSVNGLYGIYATKQIVAGALLASFPEKHLLKGGTNDFKGEPEKFWLRWILAATYEIDNPTSKYAGIFYGFEKLEDLKTYSSYFCSPQELASLKAMSPLIHRWVLNANAKADYVVDKLQKKNPSLSTDTILTIYLNVRSRGFHPQGVVPVLDQFNHSDLHGQTSVTEDDKICFYAKRAYSAGEQVFISYGPKDLYKHAIHYNYFDPTGTHLIEFARKTIQSAEGEIGEALLRHLKKFFKIEEFTNQGQKAFLVADESVILTEYGVSDGLVRFLQEACRTRLPSNVSNEELMKHATQYFAYLLEQQLKTNHVRNIDTKLITPRLQRFYDLLIKEQQILLLNLKKVTGK